MYPTDTKDKTGNQQTQVTQFTRWKAAGETGFDWSARAKLIVPCLEIISIEYKKKIFPFIARTIYCSIKTERLQGLVFFLPVSVIGTIYIRE